MMVSMKFNNFFTLLLLLLILFTFSCDSFVINRNRRAIGDYDYSRYPYVDNLVTDRVFGGPTSLGWAQVPHVMSPMFSPVFGK